MAGRTAQDTTAGHEHDHPVNLAAQSKPGVNGKPGKAKTREGGKGQDGYSQLRGSAFANMRVSISLKMVPLVRKYHGLMIW